MPEMRISGNFRTFPARLQRARREFRDCLDRAMIDALELGVEKGHEYIESRGTGNTWTRPSKSGRTGSFPGRVDTGEMRDEFKGEVDVGRNETTGSLGWTDKQELYYLLQDDPEGFVHWISGQSIAGMGALRDAGDDTWEKLKSECQNCADKFVRGI